MKIFIISSLMFLSLYSVGQPVETQIFVKSFTAANTQVGVRIRAKTGSIPFLGVTLYVLYQSANASFLSFNDSRMVTGYGWGTSTRFGTISEATSQVLTTPLTVGGRAFNRRYVYGNVDETTGSNIVTLTTAWDTVLYVSFNNLQSTAPQGGYVIAQETADHPGAALTDPSFANISIDVTTGVIPLQSPPLPVSLTKFDAQCLSNKTTAISWSTAQETNSSHFEVEKSKNGTDWKTVARVNATGNTSSTKNYDVVDPEGGATQYRLKQVDKDGKVTYSSIARTTCEGRNIYVTLYPVPARDVLTLLIGSDKAVKTSLQVFDTKGRMVINMPITLTSGSNSFKIPVHNLTAGEYVLNGTNAEFEINKRFTVVR